MNEYEYVQGQGVQIQKNVILNNKIYCPLANSVVRLLYDIFYYELYKFILPFMLLITLRLRPTEITFEMVIKQRG